MLATRSVAYAKYHGTWYPKLYEHGHRRRYRIARSAEVRASAGNLSAPTDGHRWAGQQLDEATGGIVTRSYVTNLRKGRIENPGYEKMRAIAKAMGFPPEEWFEEVPGGGRRAAPAEGRDLAGRVGHLFETVRHPRTVEPYTNAEVARMSAGVLAENEVEGIRTGAIPDPTVGQVAALAAVFGVEPSYLVNRKEPPTLDRTFGPGSITRGTAFLTWMCVWAGSRAATWR